MGTEYYDGTKLLSMMDMNGKKPELYIVTSNRTAGKTTFFARLLVNHFKRYKHKFVLIYRYNYELDGVAEKFFKDINGLFFQHDTMTSKKMSRGAYAELYLNEEPCGYAVSLNNAEQIKKMSHLFTDVYHGFFDEFQSETYHYCDDEITKFLSIHKSMARGQNKQRRYLPIYMCGNPVTIINPYYVELGISERLRSDTKFLRGDHFILEQGYNESAAQAQAEGGMEQAFKKNSYSSYAAQGVYLNDNYAFIERPKGRGRYILTIKYNGQLYGLTEFAETGVIYCDDNADATFRDRIVVTTEDHDINYVMLKRNDFIITNLRYFFEHGCFRFKNLKCKEAILKCLSY